MKIARVAKFGETYLNIIQTEDYEYLKKSKQIS